MMTPFLCVVLVRADSAAAAGGRQAHLWLAHCGRVDVGEAERCEDDVQLVPDDGRRDAVVPVQPELVGEVLWHLAARAAGRQLGSNHEGGQGSVAGMERFIMLRHIDLFYTAVATAMS